MPDNLQAPDPLDVVMLVDDDAFILDVMAEMLAQIGAKQILKLDNARDALKSFAVRHPSLLICDLSMPEMDGIEFLNLLANMKYRGFVVLHSGVKPGVIRAAEHLAKANGLRVLGTFEKPIDKHALMEVLRRFAD